MRILSIYFLFALIPSLFAVENKLPIPAVIPAKQVEAADNIDSKVIAIVRDADSPFFNVLVEKFQKELIELSDDAYTFEIRDTFNANGNPEDVKSNVLKALRDPKVDVVYTAGILASAAAQSLPAEERIKPVMAGAIEFSNFNNEGVSKDGTSSIPNFTFIMESRRISEDLMALAKLTDKNTLYCFVDGAVMRGLSGAGAEKVRRLEQRSGIKVNLLSVGSTAASCLSVLPKGVKSVYVPIIPSLSFGERKKLFDGLTKRGVISFSMAGAYDVKNGAVAGLSPDNGQALFRRTALNIHQMLSGVPTSLLPVVLVSNDQLRINIKTAKKVGLYLDYDTLLAAELVDNVQFAQSGKPLSLSGAMKLAENKNLDIESAKQRWLASYWQTQSLRTSQRPQVQLNGQWNHQGISDPISAFSEPNTDSAFLGAQISQLLYSDRITSQIRSQREVEAATKLDMESVKLDSIQEAGTAYIDCLLTEALYQVEKRNLALASQNKSLAQTRSDIGAAEASEVYRWQASLAQSRAQLIQRDIARKNALVALNVAMSQPRTKNWNFQDIEVKDDDFYFMNKALHRHVKTQRDFDRYTHFVKKLAVWNAPELKAFQKNLTAQGISLAERNRRNFLPEVSLTATARRSLSEVSQHYDAQSEWTVGVGFTIPLFEGGLKNTETKRFQAIIAQLQAQRDKARYQIEQQALSGVYLSSSSHPTLRLSRVAVEASKKNYDAVKSKYSQGAASVVDLLDAQSQLITQQQSEVSAKYQYLKDIISIQRAMAWFEYSKSSAEKRQWERQLSNFMRTGSIHLNTINSAK